jgi:hypothetical protein
LSWIPLRVIDESRRELPQDTLSIQLSLPIMGAAALVKKAVSKMMVLETSSHVKSAEAFNP